MRSTFLSIMSHELQTPLTIIRGYAGTLLRPDACWDTETLRQAVQAIDQEAARLSGLLASLLTAARLQASRLTLEREALDLAILLRRLGERLGATLAPGRLIVQAPGEPLLVSADATRLEEVVLNLVENGLKYSQEHTTIMLLARHEAEGVVVSVADHGVGIAPADQPRVFERFYRADTSLARTTPGSGLGLYLCQAIIEAHGGRIWLQSALGRGTIVSFWLPTAPAETEKGQGGIRL